MRSTLHSLEESESVEALCGMPGAERARLAWLSAAHEAQRPPRGDWSTWLFLGGRGAGKTRAGAEWTAMTAEALGPGGRIALVGPTLHDVRSVMVEGPSGLLNLPWRTAPVFEPSQRRLRFESGAVALMFSADAPERLRGPQFHAAWGDELCSWSRASDALANLRLGLRLGATARLAEPRCLSADAREQAWTPKLMLSSTPKPSAMLRGVLAEAGLRRTDAATAANAAHLSGGFLSAMQALYGGTRRAAQELEGRVLEAEGALFGLAEIERARALGRDWGGLCERVVVAVDPPAGTLSGRARDACGIVVAGTVGSGALRRALVIDDRTARGLSPDRWAERVRIAAVTHGASCVVVETNQGGAMAEAVLKTAGIDAPVRRVHASVGKVARAEPVAALYEQGKVAHAGGLGALEEELMGLGEDHGGGASPDRADALVWAITSLMLGTRDGPRVRRL